MANQSQKEIYSVLLYTILWIFIVGLFIWIMNISTQLNQIEKTLLRMNHSSTLHENSDTTNTDSLIKKKNRYTEQEPLNDTNNNFYSNEKSILDTTLSSQDSMKENQSINNTSLDTMGIDTIRPNQRDSALFQ